MLADFLLQTAVDFVATVAERHLVLVLKVVIGVEAGHFAQSRVALHGHEAVVRGGFHIEAGAVGVLHLPHQHQADHDGVAVAVVDLDGLHVHVVGAEAHLLAGVEGIGPEETVVAHSAHVFTKESKYARVVGLDDHHLETRDVQAPKYPADASDDAAQGEVVLAGVDAQIECHCQQTQVD